jgi:pyruvate/2-oxoglutarate dehydrogenase complex dihydrolipoamide dehydrogenase (E3) component
MPAHRRARRVYAIGDLVGPPWLAHKAMHKGVICVERISGVNDVHPLDLHNNPSCAYCRPQVCECGPDREGCARGLSRGQDRPLPVYRQR